MTMCRLGRYFQKKKKQKKKKKKKKKRREPRVVHIAVL